MNGHRKTSAIARATKIFAGVVLFWSCANTAHAHAENVAASDVVIPSFFDPNRKMQKPEPGAVQAIRFITEDDYPPFNFAGPDGALMGFNVDLARAICDELQVACTIQARRWDTFATALAEGKGDALIASLKISPQTRAQYDFSAPYFLTPARFVARAGAAPASGATPEKLAHIKVAVVAKSAHEAFLRARFPQADIRPFDTQEAARAALLNKETDLFFGDAIASAGWLADAAGAGCVFFGGPFIDPAYFGEGVGVALRKNNAPLRHALDYALARVTQSGKYAELYLKYFPVGPF
ncbi:MAG: transporter substrate-binding domain-containing protein [Hyphomicrobiales bacterium]|nr:transporter substrate-binding domain-containing protein [Hyphomicrobiales bacterium]